MSDDKVLSQADIDAMLAKQIPTKKAEPASAKTETPASKVSAPAPAMQPAAEQPAQPAVTRAAETSGGPSNAVPASAQVEYDTIPARLSRLESNYAAVKKELQALLLDLREKLLENENPFQQAPFIFKPTQEKHRKPEDK